MIGATRDLRETYPKESAIYSIIHGRPTVTLNFHETFIHDIPSITLNASQEEAVGMAIRNDFSVVKGPPGTGKTTVCAAIVYEMAQRTDKRILVCAQSNQGIDNLVERIHKTGLNIVRVVSGYKEEEARVCQEQTLHFRMVNDDLCLDEEQEEYKILKKELDGGILARLSKKERKRWMARFSMIKDQLISAVLANADVIGTTCVGSVDSRIKNKVSFGFMLMDEATQACQPEILIPIMNGITHVCLVGDNKQLGPVIKEDLARNAGLDKSMYERIRHLVPNTVLNV